MYITPKDKSRLLKHTAIILEGTANKSNGMYIGEANNPSCKENRNILLTHKVYDYNDYFTVTTAEQYKRRVPMLNSDGTVAGYHNPGDYKQRKVLRKYPIEGMDNLSVCWAIAADYPTVSYGMTAWRREAFVLDSDQTYDSLVEAKNRLDYFTTAFKLPKPNYILRNPNTKHIQAGWILDKPFTKKDFAIFNAYIKQIAIAYKDYTHCDGDICFNGPACKNPYYKGFESIIVNEQVCSINQFDYVWNYTPITNKIFTNNISLSSLSYNNTDVTVTKQLIKSTSKSGSRHYFGDNTSRDYLECKWLREWIWSCMRHDYIPSEIEARAKLDEFAIAAAKQTGKSIHAASELSSKCKCTYRWAVNHFKTTSENGVQRAGAAFGNYIQKLQSYVTTYVICQEKEKHHSCREIAAATGYSIATISRANINKIDIAEIKRFIDYYKTTEQDFQLQYKELYTILQKIFTNNISLSSLSYNNTDVTVVTDSIDNELQSMKFNQHNISKRVKQLQEFLAADYTWEEYMESTWKMFSCRPKMSEYANAYKSKDISYYQRVYNIA